MRSRTAPVDGRGNQPGHEGLVFQKGVGAGRDTASTVRTTHRTTLSAHEHDRRSSGTRQRAAGHLRTMIHAGTDEAALIERLRRFLPWAAGGARARSTLCAARAALAVPRQRHESGRAELRVATYVRAAVHASRAAAASVCRCPAGSGVAATRRGEPAGRSGEARVGRAPAGTLAARLAATSERDGDRGEPEPPTEPHHGSHSRRTSSRWPPLYMPLHVTATCPPASLHMQPAAGEQ